jgi:hypothetical protein
MDIATFRSRVDTLLAQATATGGDRSELANQVFQGTVSALIALHGNDCEQVKSLRQIAEATIYRAPGSTRLADEMLSALSGSLRNLKAELDAGFIGGLQKRMTAEVLTDFVQLAKTVLDESGDDAKNVAAVLAAAAYEDVIRRMGSSFAGIIGRDDLSKVIEALKNSGVLVAPQLGIALSYLSYRNHALHAEWGKIDRTSVQSVLAFVEQLLLKHFA